VIAHQLARPCRLSHRAPGQELDHDRLDVDDGRALDGVETGDREHPPLAAPDLDDRHAEPVRAILPPLREDPDPRPARIPARVAGAALDGRGRDPVEGVDDLGVRERLESGERLRPEPRGELDVRLDAIPVVIEEVPSVAADVADRLDRDHETNLLATRAGDPSETTVAAAAQPRRRRRVDQSVSASAVTR